MAKKGSDVKLPRSPSELSARESIALAEALAEQGRYSSAYQLLGRYVAAHPRSNDLAPVFLALGLMSLQRGQPTAAYQHLLTVMDHDPDPETEARARQALSNIHIYQRRKR